MRSSKAVGGRIIADTPVGYLEIISDGTALTGIRSVGGIEGELSEDEITAEAKRQLEEYFDKKRKRFELPLHLSGTEFQLRVWNALAEIPFGETRSYRDIAEAAGSPKA
ncbi:MAG: MGMT family protein, partial [Oscillospiraceae bacterium]|nr:MGMT family protein [Oscillospiraceae bacterium]